MTGTNQEEQILQEQLFALQDLSYRAFHRKLIPNVEEERIIGIRMPVLRRFAREFAKSGKAGDFLSRLPHPYYEEDNLHMLLITGIRDYDRCLAEVERFLPYIDNWATCDFSEPRCFRGHQEELLVRIRAWIASGETYIMRYGIGMLMRLYLEADFKPEYLELVSGIRSEEYYVNMMIAWYLATALAKQWEATIPLLEQQILPPWVHRKTIQKAVESYRITPQQKVYLKSLR